MKYVIKNVNVNVVINFFIVFDAKASILRKRQNPTITWKFVHIVVILKNELEKGKRRQKPKSHDCSLQIPCEIQTVM